MTTFPATTALALTFSNGELVGYLDNASTVTVFSVLAAVSLNLNEVNSISILVSILEGPFAAAETVDGKYTLDTLIDFQTLRGLAARCQFNRLAFDRSAAAANPVNAPPKYF